MDLLKKIFLTGLTVLSSLVSTILLSYISTNNQACKVRPEIINVNSNKPASVFYHFSIKTSKCSDSCNNINEQYAKMCVSDVVKDLKVRVFNVLKQDIKWHETCKSKCRLDASVCDNKKTLK